MHFICIDYLCITYIIRILVGSIPDLESCVLDIFPRFSMVCHAIETTQRIDTLSTIKKANDIFLNFS